MKDFPPRDFLELLAFNFDEARIWLGDRRMVMIDLAMFAELRHALIDGLGRDQARKLFVKLGFESGLRDARALVERWPSAFEQADRYGVMSPHRFQGITKLEIVSLSRDADGLIEAGEWRWLHSAEAEAHMNAYGRATEPVCWMELGYGTGYGLGLRGRVNVYQEVGCRAMGHEVCTVIGKDLAFYEDAEAFIEHFDFLKPHVAALQLPRPKVAAPRRATVVPTAAEPVADAIVGHSPALAVAKQLLESVASSSATVLITGESGVGKELFTRNLHRLSPRAAKPFVAVSCAAIPESLIEAELFGVERGAYTGAVESRAGRFERANGGTLFLDEIGSLNHAAQVKLLRAIQEREVERIGGTSTIKVDVRIVAATNEPLRALVERGEFREDLFYRLNVFPIHVPPLRDRREDIPDLMAYYLKWYNRLHGRDIAGFSFRATKALLNYRYPGNIRELQNLVERAVILTEGDTIEVSALFAYGESLGTELWGLDVGGKLSPYDGDDWSGQQVGKLGEELARLAEGDGELSWPDIEARLFASLARNVLAEVDGNISAAARQLGMKRHQLEYRLKQLGLMGTDKPQA